MRLEAAGLDVEVDAVGSMAGRPAGLGETRGDVYVGDPIAMAGIDHAAFEPAQTLLVAPPPRRRDPRATDGQADQDRRVLKGGEPLQTGGDVFDMVLHGEGGLAANQGEADGLRYPVQQASQCRVRGLAAGSTPQESFHGGHKGEHPRPAPSHFDQH